MKIFTKTTSLILALIFILGMSTSAFAAEIDISATNAKSNVSLLAADFEVTGTKLESKTTLPSFYSSKELGYTSEVRNQLYNTCWAYSAASTFESVLLKKGLYIDQFAPMHMNHWGTLKEDGTGWNRNYAGGGYSYIALGYLSSWQGPLLERAYPETTPFTSFGSLNKVDSKQAVANGIIYLDSRDIETVKTAIYEYGAAVGNYHVNDSYYNSKNSAYFCNLEGLLTHQLNGHAISIVGWDDNFSRENFNEIAKPENDGAWLCKNSWGKNWGDNGYYWISYEDEYIFDTRFGHSYTYNDIDLYDRTMSIYQNEVYGATYEFEYITNKDTLTYINVFDIDKNFDTIDKINFESTSEGALYNIYSIPLKSDHTPVKDQSKWTTLASGVLGYNGYHSIDVDDYKLTGDKFAVGVELTKNKGSGNGIGVSEWLSTGGTQIFTPNPQKGQSYIFFNYGDLVDLLDFYKDYNDDDIGGTFVIKAVAKEKEREYTIGDVDLDSVMSIIDATLIQMYLAQIKTITPKQESLADMDNDNVISVMDATLIQLTLSGKYPLEKDDSDGLTDIEDI